MYYFSAPQSNRESETGTNTEDGTASHGDDTNELLSPQVDASVLIATDSLSIADASRSDDGIENDEFKVDLSMIKEELDQNEESSNHIEQYISANDKDPPNGLFG